MILQLQSNLMKMKFSRIILINSIFFFMLLLPNISYTQDEIGSFEFDGETRRYEVYVPHNYHPNMPLVISLHGDTETVAWYKDYTRMHEVADTMGFVIVYPQGLALAWNAGYFEPNRTFPNSDDVGFISELIDTIKSNWDIDLSRVYCCGFSAGGKMSFRLIGDIGYRFAAAASVCGSLFGLANSWEREMLRHILQMHGTEDALVPYEGLDDWWPIDNMLDYWLEKNQCNLEPDTLLFPDIVPSDGCTIEKITYANCDGDSKVIHYKGIGMGHSWPSSTFTFGTEGNKNLDINANLEILNFFKEHQNPLINYDSTRDRMAYGKSIEVSHKNKYFSPLVDTLIVSAQLVNPENHPLSVYALIEGDEHSFTDSIQLYDDGLHGDGDASDNLWGRAKSLSELHEDVYRLKVCTHDLAVGTKHYRYYTNPFTTIGPVSATTFDHKYLEPVKRQYIKLVLSNEGSIRSAENLDITISTNDPRVEEKIFGSKTFSDLAAGISDTSSFSLYFYYSDGYGPDSTMNNPIHFDYTITSDGIPYWGEGSFAFTADPTVGIDDDQLNNVPKEFALEQNYPNPFNPSTKISYSIPNVETHGYASVQLKVYDILGREVSTLVNKQQKAGYYEVTWGASNHPSGIYFYRLEANTGFTQTKKLVLLK